jgi:hypothetical protein
MPRMINRERRSHAISMLVGSVAIATLACGANTLALAEDANIKSMSINTLTPYKKNTVSVASSTGAKWDTILPGQVEFWAELHVDTKWPGYVQDAGLFLGPCVDTQCGESASPLIFIQNVMNRDYHTAKNISFPTSKLQVSSIIPAAAPYGDEILKRCNQQLQPDGATKPHSFDLQIGVAFTVNTRKDAGGLGPPEVTSLEGNRWGGGDETRHGQFLAHVECLAHSNSTANPKPDPHRTKITVADIKLFLAKVVTANASPRAPAGAQCAPVKVTTRITTDKAGPVTVKQWRQVNGGPITSETRQMVATDLGGNKFGDDWVKFDSFSKTTTVQYKDEVVGGTFAPSTPWKSITVHCNGNYAAPTSNANPDNRVPPRGGSSSLPEKKKAADKARERELGAALKGEVARPRPFVDGMAAIRPLNRRPGFGVARPMNPDHGTGFMKRGPMRR